MICGAETCNLGAMIHGAELRVQFLKSFQKGSTCENLSQKGLKIKKDGTNGQYSELINIQESDRSSCDCVYYCSALAKINPMSLVFHSVYACRLI
jgi:hypothetical protein